MATANGRRALVTGASSGIGEAYARRLARDGNDLVLVARRAEKLAGLAAELSKAHGVKVEPVAADLSTDEGIAAAEKVIADGPLDWLVSSAGFATRGHLVKVAPEKIARQVRLHVEANARMVRAALPGMIDRRQGSIVVLSSLSAFLTTEHYVSYSASKAYLNMFVLGLRDELRGTGVRAQAVCPGLTKTEFMFTEEYKDFSYDSVPAWVWMTADEVVEESVAALERAEKEPVFVPGRGNRAFVALMEAPLVGAAVRAAINRLGRGKNLY
ncbi:MAG TPA: SDR family NAD(P)-dependent oxidoreductase [Myxococcales bacterium]|jgi:hypothetical protein